MGEGEMGKGDQMYGDGGKMNFGGEHIVGHIEAEMWCYTHENMFYSDIWYQKQNIFVHDIHSWWAIRNLVFSHFHGQNFKAKCETLFFFNFETS